VAPRFAIVWLLAAGAVLVVAGLTAIAAGTWFATWLYAQLPPVAIDARAVGGAATATGVGVSMIGALHLGAGILLGRGVRPALTPAVVLAATMAALTIGWGAAAVVSAASGNGPRAALVPAAMGLAVVAAGYGWAARGLIGLRERPGGRS
jgi:hypothetical protein